MEDNKIEDIQIETKRKNTKAFGLSKDSIYIKEYNMKRYQLNRDKLLNYAKEKIYCECCDCSISRGKLSCHEKTKKHKFKQQLYILNHDLLDQWPELN